MMYLRQKKGFTLIEIMIVVAIIGLLAAIAVPNLLRSRMSANDGAIADDLHAAATAIESFRSDQNPPLYPVAIANLWATAPFYLEPAVWTAAQVHGHIIAYVRVGAGLGYTLTAASVPGRSSKALCVDATGVLRGVNVPAGGMGGCAPAGGVCPVGGGCPPVTG